MSGARWERLETLFAKVQAAEADKREALLSEAGESDRSIEMEVRQLLALYEEDMDFLECRQPAAPLAPGAALCGYIVEGVLGEGGMGIVYRARRHTESSRAIKVLRAEALTSPAIRRRFERECRALRSLSHPNIVGVHEVERDSDGNHMLVMELVEGETLGSRIAKGPLPLTTALDFAAQIADALAAAHAAGLVHRDLKPQNLIVTPQGQIKLLDFGLCHWTRLDSPGVSRTGPGLLLGTASYMSPEQAQGLEVDARSDVFSFGAVFYEMLSREKAFTADNTIAILAAILHRDPKPLAEIAEPVREVVGRCLRKRADERYTSGSELSAAMRALCELGERGELCVIPSWPGLQTKLVAASIAAVIFGSFALNYWFGREQIPEPMQSILTPEFYLALQPSVSVDGKWLAFAGSRDGDSAMDIWVQPLAGGPPRQLTAEVSGARDPAFSPDGSIVAYRSDDDGGHVHVVPAHGGRTRRIAPMGRRPRFSPDGKWIAYWTGPEGSNELTRAGAARVFVVPADGGTPRQIAVDIPSASVPVWSPDGRALLVMGPNHAPKNPRPALWLTPLDGSPSRMLHDLESAAQDAAEPLEWSSSGVVTILAAIKEGWPVVEMTVSPRTWTVDKQPRVATMLPRQSSQPALTRDRLVYAATTLRTSMWTLRVKQDGTTAEAARLTRSCPGDFCLPSLTAGGRDMAYTSYHARWTIHASDRNGQRDRTLPSPADPPPWIAVDAEARHIFIPEAVGKTRGRILRQPFDGGAAEPICESCLFPWDVSPDGKFLLTMSDGAVSSVGIAKLPARKDVPYLVHPKWNLYRARFSADGRWVLFYGRTSPDMSKVMAARFDPDRQPPPEEWVSITDDGSFNGPAGWSAKGNRVYFVSYRDGYRCLWTQAVDAVTKKPRGTPRAVAHFHSAARNLKNVPRGLFGFSVSGDWIAYELGELSGKIYSTRRW